MVSAVSSLCAGVFTSADDAMPRECLMPVHVLQGEHGSRVAEIMSLAKLTKSIPPWRGFSTRLTGSRRRKSPQVEGEVSNLAVPNSPFPFWHSCHEGWTVYSRKKTQIFVVRGKNGNLQPLVINIINLAVQFHRIVSPQELSLGLFRITWKMSIVRDFKNFTYSCKKSFLNFLTCWNCYRST